MTFVNWLPFLLLGLLLTLIGVFIYWQLVVAEGAYLGPRVVAQLYDWFAPRYDKVKEFDPDYDALTLAEPVMMYLEEARGKRQEPRTKNQESRVKNTEYRDKRQESNIQNLKSKILDVGTGTGRMPAALLAQPQFDGHIVAMDLSPKMLALAQANLTQNAAKAAARVTFMLHDAQTLPFDDAHFDVVTCLEALEFFARPQLAVREMLRVLKPGGLLMLSNRVGPDMWKLPGRAMPTPQFVAQLATLGGQHIESETWMVDYDLVRAIKA